MATDKKKSVIYEKKLDTYIKVRVSKEMQKTMQLLARSEGRTASGWIRRVIEKEFIRSGMLR